MANLALFPHRPSRESIDFVRSLGGYWWCYHYAFHVEEGQFETILQEVVRTVETIHEKNDLESAGRIILAPPGLSVAVEPMCEAIRGISGKRPEILMLRRTWSGIYVPFEHMPLLSSIGVYEHFRQLRSHGRVVKVGQP